MFGKTTGKAMDFDSLDKERTRWVSLVSPAGTIEVLLKYASPREAERFRQRLVNQGIMRAKDGTHSINTGRDNDFFRAYAKYYVLDWRGDIEVEYDSDKLAKLLAASDQAFQMLSAAISEEAAFFNGNESV